MTGSVGVHRPVGGSSDVLIVGAGPTGLALACLLNARGVSTRVVDRRQRPSSRSKAVLLWSRSLEVLGEIGVIDSVMERSLPLAEARYVLGAKVVATAHAGRITGTRYPPRILPQNVTEELLLERYRTLHGEVEWATEVLDVSDGEEVVTVRTQGNDGTQSQTCAKYVAGCDGLRSVVRTQVGIGWEGGAFEEEFVLGDATAHTDLDRNAAHHFLGSDGFVIAVPLPGGLWRFVGSTSDAVSADGPYDGAIQSLIDRYGPGGIRLERLEWADTFRVTRRLASTFNQARVVLAGDAAHVHSPAGGQGLNTGLQDAHNLAWKLDFVLRTAAPPALLDTYTAERRPVAADILKLTDRQAKRLFLARAPIARVARRAVLGAMDRGALDRRMLPAVAQLTVDYSASPLTAGRRVRRAVLRPGSRVPHLPVEFESGPGSLLTTCSGGPLVIVSLPGTVKADLERIRALAARYPLVVRMERVVTIEDSPLARYAGHVLVIRPDGHLAYLGRASRTKGLQDWFAGALHAPRTPSATTYLAPDRSTTTRAVGSTTEHTNPTIRGDAHAHHN